MLIETVKANKYKVMFMLVNDLLQALLEGVVLALTFNLLTVLQSGNLSSSGQEWLNRLFFGSVELPTKLIITWLLAFIALGTFSQSILKYCSRIAGLKIAASVKKNIIMIVGQLMKRVDYLRLQNMRTGNVITVCLESPEAIRQQFEIYANIFIAIFYLSVYVFVLAAYSLNEFIFAALCISIIGFIQLYLSLKAKKWAIILANGVSHVNNIMGDLVRGFKFLKSSSSMHVILNKLDSESTQVKKSYLKAAYFSELSSPLGKALGIVSIGFIALIFIYSSNEITGILPKLAIFIVALQRLIGKANEVFSLGKDFAQNRGRLMLYNTFIDNYSTNNELTDNLCSASSVINWQDADLGDKNGMPKYILFDQVYFRYPMAGFDSLCDINVSFESGDFVGITGHSGSGKSTFADLITGLIIPSSGSISINNSLRDQFSETKDKLAHNLFLVDQEGFICHGTIKENIIWSSTFSDNQHIWDCLRIVNLDDYVHTLPLGIDTIVGEGGLNMSGGQMQRLCIARALYQQKEILVLDEATSGLDKVNEKEILERIKARYKSKIVIMITHNINNLHFATKCLYFKSGRISACGSYQSVLPYINKHPSVNL